MLKPLTGMFVYGTYLSCLAWGIGLALLPYAVGAHVAMLFMPDPTPEVDDLVERVKKLENAGE